MNESSRDKAINRSITVGGNDPLFGDCLKLLYYHGPMEDWMVAMSGFYIAMNVVSALITLAANMVFLVTYFKTPPLRTPHNFFLMFLAITDISVGLITQPLFIARKIMQIYDVHNCALWTTLQATLYYFSGVSLFTVTLVSIERYLAVCRPLTHRKDVTPNRMAVVGLIVWVVWLPFPIVRFTFSEFYKAFGIFMVGIILFLVAANALIYVKIYLRFSENKRQNNTLKLRKVTLATMLKKEDRLARTAICLLIFMIFTYLPTIFGSIYKALAGIDTAYFFGFVPFAYTLVLLNSSFNPLFYCFKNKNIREAIRMFINGTKPRKRTTSTAPKSVSTFNVYRMEGYNSARPSTQTES